MANYNQVSYGSQGEDVTRLQKLLNQNGYNLRESGTFDTDTETALKSYQEKSGLDADGIAGNQTWSALSGKQTTMPSSGVEQAQAQIAQQLNSGSYQSAWQKQLNDAINKILNREKFSYDINGDALYQQYKDAYITQGQQAMIDTMGQAQAMTGGYGNSYAQMAGQQAYQGYLQQLNDKIPELYQLALSKYQTEGEDLYNQYAVLNAQDAQDYERYADDRAYEYQIGRDEVADSQWQAEFDEAVRQFNFANKLGEFAVQSSGSGGSGVYSSPQSDLETGDVTTMTDVANAAAKLNAAGASPSEVQAVIKDMVNSSGYVSSTSDDLTHLISGYVKTGR